MTIKIIIKVKTLDKEFELGPDGTFVSAGADSNVIIEVVEE